MAQSQSFQKLFLVISVAPVGARGFGREVGRDADFAGIDPRQDSEFQTQH